MVIDVALQGVKCFPLVAFCGSAWMFFFCGIRVAVSCFWFRGSTNGAVKNCLDTFSILPKTLMFLDSSRDFHVPHNVSSVVLLAGVGLVDLGYKPGPPVVSW